MVTRQTIGFVLAFVVGDPVLGTAASWEALGPPGANCQSVALDPVTPDTVYLGVYRSGVWKSTDRGATWTPTGFGLGHVPYSIAVDPVTPSIVYAGGYRDIVRSIDGGATWTHLDTGLVSNETAYALVVDPATPSTIYAGVAKFVGVQTGGVLKSVDSGTAWVRMNTGLTDLEVYALAIDPITPSTIFAGTGAGVFKSQDGGASWAIAGTGAAEEAEAIAVDPKSPSTVWAGTEDGVFRSDDGGDTWTATSPTTLGDTVVSFAVDPATPGVVYAGSYNGTVKTTDSGATWVWMEAGASIGLAIDPQRPSTVYRVNTGGLYKTTNAGGSWFRSEDGLHGHDLVSIATDPTHPGTFYGSNFHLLFTTTDFGATWSRDVVPTSDVYQLAFDARHHRLSFVTQHRAPDGAAGYSTSDGGKRWRKSRGLETDAAVSIAAAPTDSRIMYAGTFGGIFKSRNGGRRWRLLETSPRTQPTLGFAVDPTSASIVYAAVPNLGVFKTADGGQTWNAMNTGLTDLAVGLVAIDPNDPSTVYTGGFVYDRIFKSTNGGASWTEASNGLPQGAVFDGGSTVSALLVDPLDSSTIYAGVRGSGIFRSTDGGTSWAAFNPSMTAQNVTQLIVGPATTVYAGTTQGLFRLVGP